MEEIRSLLKLAFPIILAQLGNIGFGIVDTLMVSPLGADRLAAVAFANTLFTIPMIFLVGVTAATSVVVSQGRGQIIRESGGRPPDFSSLSKWLFHSLGLSAASSLFILVSGYALYHLADHLGQPPEIVSQAKDFFVIVMASLVLVNLFYSYRQFCEGFEKPIVPLVVTYFGLGLNAFLNWILIYGIWGAPEMGILGAAWATFISRLLMLIVLASFVHFGPTFREILRAKANRGSFWSHAKKLFFLGAPGGLQYLLEVGAFGASSIFMGWFGTEAIAAHQITLNIAATSFMVALGISIASSIRVGEAIGEQRRDLAYRRGRIGFLLAFCFMGTMGVVFLFSGADLARLFTQDVQVIELVTSLLVVAAAFQVFDGLQAVGIGVLRGCSDVKIPTLITVLAYWMIALPMSYYLAFQLQSGPVSIWVGLALGLGVAAILLVVRFRRVTQSSPL